jgi:hypothetical protein
VFSDDSSATTWLLILACGVVGLLAVLHLGGAPPPESPPVRPPVVSPAIPKPLPGESATGGSPTGELAVLGTNPGWARLAPSSAPGPGAIPGAVFAGYLHAETVLAMTAPRCHLEWPVVAAVGYAVSGHARGGQVDSGGRTVARLVGPRLTGSFGLLTIPDTDRGRWDGDMSWDRAVGPMQIVPSIWRRYSEPDRADPDSVGDSAVTAGRYLCAGGADLSQPAELRAAIARYCASELFVASVLATERDYRALTRARPTFGQGASPRTLGASPVSPTPVIPPRAHPTRAPATQPARSPPAPHMARKVPSPLPTARSNGVVPPTPGAEVVAGAPSDRVAARVGTSAGAPESGSSGYGGGGNR